MEIIVYGFEDLAVQSIREAWSDGGRKSEVGSCLPERTRSGGEVGSKGIQAPGNEEIEALELKKVKMYSGQRSQAVSLNAAAIITGSGTF